MLEAGFCGGNKIPQALIDNRNKVLEWLNKITINKQKFNEMWEKPNNIKDILKTLDEKEIHLKSQLNVFDKKIEYFERLFLLNTVLKWKWINWLFDYVDSITTNNGYKYLLDFLRKYGPDNLKNLNIDIVPLKDRKTNTWKEFGWRYFSPNNENLLELNPDFFSDTNNNDKAIYIVMHELWHVVTSNIIKAMHNYNPLFQIKELGLNSADIMKDKKNYEKVLNFLSLHPLHKSTFERLWLLKTELLGKHWNDEKGLLPISIMEYSDKSSNHYDFTKFYAFSNTAELISESLANPVIQKTLSEVPYQRKTSSIEADKFLSLLWYNNKNTFLHEYVSNIMNYCKEQNIRSL